MISTEISPLEGIDLGTPPCECILNSGDTCGKPSAYRLVSYCENCGDVSSGFTCAPCWHYIRLFLIPGQWVCFLCGAPRLARES